MKNLQAALGEPIVYTSLEVNTQAIEIMNILLFFFFFFFFWKDKERYENTSARIRGCATYIYQADKDHEAK